MRQLGIFEAKNKLSELVEQAEQGHRTIITRKGKPVAELGPVGASSRADESVEKILNLDWKLGGSVVKLVRDARAERG